MPISLKTFEEQYKDELENDPKLARMFESMKELVKHAKNEPSRVRVRTVQSYTVDPVEEYTAEQIRAIRVSKGFTQETFAKILGVTKSAVEKWETNKGKPVGSVSRLIKLIESNAPSLELFYRVG